jgi:alkylhydroperoxidase family enzyme
MPRNSPERPELWRLRSVLRPRRLIELVIFRTAQIVGSDHELNQHTPLMKLCSYSDQQIAEIADWRRSMSFDDKQRAALGYVEQMAP